MSMVAGRLLTMRERKNFFFLEGNGQTQVNIMKLAWKWLPVAVALLGLYWAIRGSELLGATIMSNKVTFASQRFNGVYSSYITLHDPPSFRDAVLVYDPAAADFDGWVVRVTYGGRRGTRMSTMQRVKGLPFPPDPSKRMVQLFRPVASTGGYTKPRQPRESTYVHKLSVEFMYKRGPAVSEAEHQRRLAMLDGLRRTARVMLQDAGGQYRDVARYGPRWNYRPVLHSS